MAETSHSAEPDPIARARQLLGDEADDLTDAEVLELLNQARAVARVIVQAKIDARARP